MKFQRDFFGFPIFDTYSRFSTRYMAGPCLVPRRFGLFTSLSARGTAREGEKRKIDQIDPRGQREGHASHRTTHSAWVRGSGRPFVFRFTFLKVARKFAPPANLPGKGPAEEVAQRLQKGHTLYFILLNVFVPTTSLDESIPGIRFLDYQETKFH